MRNFVTSVDEAHLVKCLDIRRKATVNAENLSLDDSACAKKIENFSTEFPWVGITIFSNAFIVISINL